MQEAPMLLKRLQIKQIIEIRAAEAAGSDPAAPSIAWSLTNLLCVMTFYFRDYLWISSVDISLVYSCIYPYQGHTR